MIPDVGDAAHPVHVIVADDHPLVREEGTALIRTCRAMLDRIEQQAALLA